VKTLVEANNGVVGGGWFHAEGGDKQRTLEPNCRRERERMQAGTAHAGGQVGAAPMTAITAAVYAHAPCR
jgi:hypothetical protein